MKRKRSKEEWDPLGEAAMRECELHDADPAGYTFAQFWQLYPRKDGKQAALKAWGKLSQAEREAICGRVAEAHAELWRLKGTEPRYIPHASTWLNQRRFEDELDWAPSTPPAWARPWAEELGFAESQLAAGGVNAAEVFA